MDGGGTHATGQRTNLQSSVLAYPETHGLNSDQQACKTLNCVAATPPLLPFLMMACIKCACLAFSAGSRMYTGFLPKGSKKLVWFEREMLPEEPMFEYLVPSF